MNALLFLNLLIPSCFVECLVKCKCLDLFLFMFLFWPIVALGFLMLLVVGAVKAEAVFFASSSAVTGRGCFLHWFLCMVLWSLARGFFYKVC